MIYAQSGRSLTCIPGWTFRVDCARQPTYDLGFCSVNFSSTDSGLPCVRVGLGRAAYGCIPHASRALTRRAAMAFGHP